MWPPRSQLQLVVEDKRSVVSVDYNYYNYKLQLAFFKASVKRNDKQAAQIWPC